MTLRTIAVVHLGFKEQVEQYHRCLAEFNRWEEWNPTPARSPEAVLADLGFLMSLVPREERRRDPDPEKLGIQKMRQALALWSGRS